LFWSHIVIQVKLLIFIKKKIAYKKDSRVNTVSLLHLTEKGITYFALGDVCILKKWESTWVSIWDMVNDNDSRVDFYSKKRFKSQQGVPPTWFQKIKQKVRYCATSMHGLFYESDKRQGGLGGTNPYIIPPICFPYIYGTFACH